MRFEVFILSNQAPGPHDPPFIALPLFHQPTVVFYSRRALDLILMVFVTVWSERSTHRGRWLLSRRPMKLRGKLERPPEGDGMRL